METRIKKIIKYTEEILRSECYDDDIDDVTSSELEKNVIKLKKGIRALGMIFP